MIDLEAIRCLSDIPAAQAKARGGEVAVLFGARETTFAQLAERQAAVARALVASGIAPGDRVAVLTRNHDAWYPLFFGAARARACLTPVNCRLVAGEIAFIIGDAAPKLLFVGEGLFETALEAIAGLADPPRLIALHGAHFSFEPFNVWLENGGRAALPGAPEADDDVLQLYTSGTTGRPKGVVLGNRNYRRFMEMAAKVDGFSYSESETVMIVMPLFHVAGTNVSLAGLAQGCRLVLVRDFDADAAVEMMQRESVSHTFLAPAMIRMMLQTAAMSAARFDALQTIAYGASPIAEDVLVRARAAFGCGFVQFYGMTETTGAGSYLSPAGHEVSERLKSCGRPWPDVEVAILGPDGASLAPGEIGEIAIRGDIVMKGYWNRPEATSETLAGGWLHTGDAGYADEHGYFYVHDRIKDMIVSGGENVYPAEVENAILGCPGVADVAVIGVPDARWGEAVKALVVANGAPPAAEDVIAWARSRIAGYKVPKSVDIVETLPRNAAGKVLRRELRRPYWEGRGRAVG
ncbi:long-chain-fatty-acid--CoA ligase [Sphingosinicella soli]|uniref:3-methylmercaptopropionyl-CoA ligase n=1 Tax=Sphingosinicella soli TaxID=333708 RepID=A0A7W7B434_9SPHN|nr:long-chain-fatty-acid--CoA ligase [Sphingosinicella soli]MBB4632733.1 acyl-CoA synthetase (AMP-forming)/AMP-acid ligase II [Sphingosinicella soli]